MHNSLKVIGAVGSIIGAAGIVNYYARRVIDIKLPDPNITFSNKMQVVDALNKQDRTNIEGIKVRGKIRNDAQKIRIDAAIARAKYGPKFRLKDMKRRD